MSEMGWSDEIGYEEIGVDEMGRRVLRPKRRAYNPNLPPAGGPNLVADRLFPLPCNDPAAVAAAGTGNAVANPQSDCKPVRYIVHQVYDTAAPAVLLNPQVWLLNWIQIGQRLQAIANGGATGDMFGATAVATGIEFDTAQMSQQITVNYTDMGGISAGKTATFRSTFLCKALHY